MRAAEINMLYLKAIPYQVYRSLRAMTSILRSWLTPPLFDDEAKTRQAYILHYILLTLLAVPVCYTAYIYFREPEQIRIALAQSIPGELINILLFILIRKGYVKAASILQVALFWLFFTLVAYTDLGVRGTAYILGNATVIVIAGILLGGKGTLVVTFLTLITGGWMTYLETSGQRFVNAEPGSSQTIWAISSILFIVINVVQFLSAKQQAGLVSAMTKRAIQLQTAAEVSRAASSTLDLEELLTTAVELIRSHFNYYYTGIFLLNEAGTFATLNAATGEAGNLMIASGHKLEVGDSSMVGWSIAHRKARITLDVGEDAVHFKNPHLPLTRSEIALPLVSRGEVIGAMTIQSELSSAFSSADVTALQTMADQIANAISNAQLFTERSNLIKELEGRNAELERFTYTVSHDLKSPLVTIRGFLGFIQEDAKKGDMGKFENDMSKVANAANRMQDLLNDLLELSRVGRIVNPPQDLPFEQIIRETMELLAGSFKNGNIQVDIQKDLPVIRGDHTRLVEVMQNLLGNAIKFMGDQPEPHIEIGTDGYDANGMAVLFVRDNGIGIDPQYHERVFGLFNRLNPNIEGTGVGLTLVRRIVEVHGGRVWLDSKPGTGSVFFFTLPLGNSK